jgi:3D (Asp-Asp-Asp) domain-containing protein
VTAPPPVRPDSRRRRRLRRQRLRIAIELGFGAAAIGFVLHPVAFPKIRAAAPAPESVAADRDTADRDASATDSSGGAASRAVRDSSAAKTRIGRLAMAAIPSVLVPKGHLFRSIEERARAGERIAVSVTAYCLQGRTRRDNLVRDGIIAVDRKLFPLGHEVDLFFGRMKYGRFLADDTGGVIKGGRIDVWMADCSAARRFGRRRGYAQLVRRSQ